MAKKPQPVDVTGDSNTAPLFQVLNADKVTKKIRAMMKDKQKGFSRGLLKAGHYLQRQSQKVVPLDTGILRASAYTKKTGSGSTTEVTVGYTAPYALRVHELPQSSIRKKGRTNKYLERPARENRGKMNDIIAAETKKA